MATAIPKPPELDGISPSEQDEEDLYQKLLELRHVMETGRHKYAVPGVDDEEEYIATGKHDSREPPAVAPQVPDEQSFSFSTPHPSLDMTEIQLTVPPLRPHNESWLYDSVPSFLPIGILGARSMDEAETVVSDERKAKSVEPLGFESLSLQQAELASPPPYEESHRRKETHPSASTVEQTGTSDKNVTGGEKSIDKQGKNSASEEVEEVKPRAALAATLPKPPEKLEDEIVPPSTRKMLRTKKTAAPSTMSAKGA